MKQLIIEVPYEAQYAFENALQMSRDGTKREWVEGERIHKSDGGRQVRNVKTYTFHFTDTNEKDLILGKLEPIVKRFHLTAQYETSNLSVGTLGE